MAHGLFVGLLLVKEIGVGISAEMPSQEIPEQCHAADGITYLQTHHFRQKMGDDVGAAVANGANHTSLNCTASGACCFEGEDGGDDEVVNMEPLQNGCGDLCCSGYSSCSHITATTRSADCQSGGRSNCVFAGITAGDTVRCLERFACNSARINFAGTTSQSCLKCEGESACFDGRVTVDGDKSLQITCSGEDVCSLLGITLGDDTCLQITCSGANACAGMVVSITGNGTCYYNGTDGAQPPITTGGFCTLVNETDKCPGSCPTPACCAGFGNATDDGDCSNVDQCGTPDACGATTTTSSTIATTTTTTTTPPYNRNYFRRARRARRRARRRNHRQYQEHFSSQ